MEINFFRLLFSNCLNWKINCDDHPSLSSTTAVYQLRTTCYTHDAYTKSIELILFLHFHVRSLDMLMSIDKSRYKLIANPENSVTIDFYRQIKPIDRQLSTIIEHYRLIDYLSDDRFRSTCYCTCMG